MENLVRDNIFLLYITSILLVAITGVKLRERARVALVYAFSFVLALVGSVSALSVLIGATMVLFMTLEILCEDNTKAQLYVKFRYKLADFLYYLFVEYYYHYFLGSVILLTFNPLSPYNRIAAGLLLIMAVVSIVSLKYATRSASAIINRLESSMPLYLFGSQMNPQLGQQFAMLTRMEDHTFFARKESQHSIPVETIIRKGREYLRVQRGQNIVRTISNLFSRGYGTIEMQLIRSIGIELGYDAHKYRRKIFEFLYANMLFNSYRDYLERRGINCDEFRSFIIWHYIENVHVSINGKSYYPTQRSSLLRLFDRPTIHQVTDEEFFIWCLGLPQWDAIGPHVLGMYAPVIHEFGLDVTVIHHKLNALSAAHRI